MKKETLMIISCLVVALFTLSYCNNAVKPLFYQENGNYVVDNNFIIQKTVPLSAEDVKQLITLNAAYDSLTRGAAILVNIAQVSRIRNLNRLTTIDKIARLTRYDRIQQILDINHGCFETQEINWAEYGDLKAKLDGILDKYKPAMVDGNVSISNNQIATSVTALKAEDVSAFDAMTLMGADEINICGDYMGRKAFTHWLHTVNKVGVDKDLSMKVDKILATYNSKQ